MDSYQQALEIINKKIDETIQDRDTKCKQTMIDYINSKTDLEGIIVIDESKNAELSGGCFGLTEDRIIQILMAMTQRAILDKFFRGE
jgi:hypothetical protein